MCEQIGGGQCGKDWDRGFSLSASVLVDTGLKYNPGKKFQTSPE